MAPKYARDQPAAFTNRIENVAIVGGSGQVGKHITAELLKTGKHTVTALTRPDSKNKLPDGVKVVPVNYDDEPSLVAALRGKQFFIITMSVIAPKGAHSKLVQAAAKAGVPYIMPNGYGIDVANKDLVRESLIGIEPRAHCDEIEATGVSSWISLVCGMWYEYSMVMGPEWLGFDLKAKKLTLYDDGDTKINISTWEQCGRAVAALLSLKEIPQDENDTDPTVSGLRNKPLYVSSFLISQKDMFESWKRVTGDTDEQWTIESELCVERYNRGLASMEKGDRLGAAMAAFVRGFYPNGDGDYESRHGLANGLLGLPTEDLDERTRVAKELLEQGYSTWARERSRT